MPSPRNSRLPKPSPRASTLSRLTWTRSSAPRPQPPLASGRGTALVVGGAEPCCASVWLYRQLPRILMYAVIQQGVKENSKWPLRSKSLPPFAASPKARRGWTVVAPPSRKPSTSLLPASLLSAATSATTRGKSANSSMFISTRKTSASWAGNPALSRKAIAFYLSLRLPADTNCTHRWRLWRVRLSSTNSTTATSRRVDELRLLYLARIIATFYPRPCFRKHEATDCHLRSRFPAPSGVSCAFPRA